MLSNAHNALHVDIHTSEDGRDNQQQKQPKEATAMEYMDVKSEHSGLKSSLVWCMPCTVDHVLPACLCETVCKALDIRHMICRLTCACKTYLHSDSSTSRDFGAMKTHQNAIPGPMPANKGRSVNIPLHFRASPSARKVLVQLSPSEK